MIRSSFRVFAVHVLPTDEVHLLLQRAKANRAAPAQSGLPATTWIHYDAMDRLLGPQAAPQAAGLDPASAAGLHVVHADPFARARKFFPCPCTPLPAVLLTRAPVHFLSAAAASDPVQGGRPVAQELLSAIVAADAGPAVTATAAAPVLLASTGATAGAPCALPLAATLSEAAAAAAAAASASFAATQEASAVLGQGPEAPSVDAAGSCALARGIVRTALEAGAPATVPPAKRPRTASSSLEVEIALLRKAIDEASNQMGKRLDRLIELLSAIAPGPTAAPTAAARSNAQADAS